MNQTITETWRPAKKTSNSLLNAGYTQEQLNRIGKIFVERYENKEMDDASSTFRNMVRSSEAAHGIKRETPASEIEADEKRASDLKSRSKDSKKKVESIYDPKEPMTQEQAIIEYERRRG